jgi:L-alanine-DL-glutamate epimerase-like enolase superfamily enzyme
MKISAIKVSAINVPTLKSYRVAVLGTIRSTQSVIVEVHTDEGLVGIGETDPALMFTGESQQTVMTMLKHHLGPAVLGMDPMRLEAMHQRMEAVCLGNPFAKAAIDLACHDLIGKALGAPVYQLLGGLVHERIPVMWSLGSDTPEVNAKEAAEKVESGYTTIGIKLGVLSPDEDLERVAQVRQAVGDKVQLRCDANQGWSVGTAIRTINRLEEYGVAMIEQPVPKWDLEGLAQIVRTVNIPVGVDESLSSVRDALHIIQAGAADFYSIKTTKHGGLLNSKKIAALTASAGGKIFVNSMIELGVSVMSGLHFAASTPSLFEIGHAINSVRRLRDDILKQPVLYDGGDIIVPQDCVGLGVELDEKKMAQYRLAEFWVKG